jgi:cleavage stimulation factor subunit 3
MSDLFPEDPQLVRFSHRSSAPGFDPTAIRPIISPATQSKPKALPSIEQPPPQPPSVQNSPRPAPAIVQISNSPKRPFVPDESDSEAAQPRKIPRGESPLKGAAGRRLDAARRNQARASESLSSTLNMPQAAPPPSLPRDILFLLSIIPGAHTYKETRFNAERMVELLRNTDLNRPVGNQTRQTPMPPQVGGYGQVGGEYQLSGFLKSAVVEIRWSLQS